MTRHAVCHQCIVAGPNNTNSIAPTPDSAHRCRLTRQMDWKEVDEIAGEVEILKASWKKVSERVENVTVVRISNVKDM